MVAPAPEPIGVPFQRQHVIGRFVVDFCCPTALLVIEVDGDVHQATDVAEQDAWQARQLHDLGFHMMRFSNDAVLYDTGAVIEQIRRRLTALV